MSYEGIKRTYSHLTNEELQQELKDRTARRYDTHKVGSAGCMVDAWVIRVCKELLTERGVDSL